MISTRLERSIITTITWLLIFSICIFIISSTFSSFISAYCSETGTFLWLVEQSVLARTAISLFVIIIGGLLFFLLYHYISKSLHSETYKVRKNFIRTGIILTVSLSLICIILLIIIRPVNLPSALNNIVTNPGGFFVFITGVFTLMGSIIAVQTIQEMKQVIVSYQHMLERATELINNSSDPDEEIKMVCYTPLPGWWQVESQVVKKAFYKALLREDRKINLICLTNTEHIRLLLTIAKIRNVKETWIKVSNNGKNDVVHNNRTKNADDILDFHSDLSHSILTHLTKHGSYKQLEWKFMPTYYFIVNSNKAIIVTPVGLPIIDSKISEVLCNKIHDYKKPTDFTKNKSHQDFLTEINSEINKPTEEIITANNLNFHTKKVNTYGFETNDHRIIESLNGIYLDLINDDEQRKETEKNSNDIK